MALEYAQLSRRDIPDIMDDLTEFQRDLLYAVAGLDEPSGLEVRDELDDYYTKEIPYGQLYPNLDALIEKGLLEKNQLDWRTNSYTLTQRGQNELIARREWEEQYFDP